MLPFLKVNVLITHSGHACIADFGLLTIVSDPTNTMPSSSVKNAGTTRWMGPELLYPRKFGLENSQPTKSSDCYALGMVILEVLSGQVPFASDKDFVVMRKVTNGERPERPREVWFTDDLWRILEQCWSSQPENRPTAEVVLECLGPLSAVWQPLPPKDGEVERYFNDSHSTASYSCMFLLFILSFMLNPYCSRLNDYPGYNSYSNPPHWYTKLGTSVIIFMTWSCRAKYNFIIQYFTIHSDTKTIFQLFQICDCISH